MHTNRPRRRSMRLKGYDYAQPGMYFVTCCTHQRLQLFGDAIDGAMVLDDNGFAVSRTWLRLPNHYPCVMLDAFVVMPNHMHGVVVLADSPVGRTGLICQTRSRHGLSEIVRALKTYSARRINRRRRSSGVPVWQRGYYDHIILSERSLQRIQDYIAANPALWDLDAENVEAAVPNSDAYYRAIWQR